MASVINKVAHGLTTGNAIRFANVVPVDCGVDETVTYYVLAAGLTADAFEFSDTLGGTPFVLTSNMTDGSIYQIDSYVETADGVMDAPTTPSDPVDAPTLSTLVVNGVNRLFIQVPSYTDSAVRVRAYEVRVTHNFVAGVPQFDQGQVLTMPSGSTGMSIPCLGNTLYNAEYRVQDVFGNYSGYSPVFALTTDAGVDALIVPDASITSGKIAPLAVQTQHLDANSVTAGKLAAVIILASLLKTADTGRRIEVDIDGIRLYDASEGLLVRIPTNGDPVYVRGTVDADQLVSETAATFRTAVSLESGATMTVQGGVATPAAAPTAAASIDSQSLLSTPGSITAAAGIAYDGTAKSYWIACDPTVSPYYVAQEFAAEGHATLTPGTLIRSIAATGSTTTTTTTVGSTSHVSDSASGFDGSTNSHIMTPIAMPRLGTVTKVAAYFAGHNGSCQARVGIYDAAGAALRESATFTASSGGSTTLGASDLHNVSLSSGLPVASGYVMHAGFRHTSSGEGFQFDRDDGSGKTTKSGDGTAADATGYGTLYSSSKPNVYVTYTYDVDTRLETLPNIGIAVDPTNGWIYTLDTSGVIWKYDRTTLAHSTHSSIQTAIAGTKSKAGLFYDSVAGELLITTTTGTGAGVFPRLVRVNTSTLAVSSTVYSAAAGTTFSGTTDQFRGGGRLNDPLNGSTATYWLATTSAVYAYTFSGTTLTQTSNRDFGQAATVADGLVYNIDQTSFRGWAKATPTKVWKFSNYDFTTANTKVWIAYSWYDGQGTAHETAVSPRTSLTVRRRERILVTTPTVPSGGVDDPDHCRVYTLHNATDTGVGTYFLQNGSEATNQTSRYLTAYDTTSAHDGVVASFGTGTAAELKSATSGWSLKGDGTVVFGTAVTPGGKPPVVNVYTAAGANTWTRPAGLSHIVVEVVGGGGGGGAADAAAAGQNSKGGGGGGGGYARKLIAAASMSGNGTATVGGGGASATDGTDSTFAVTGQSTITGSGGKQGVKAASSAAAGFGSIGGAGGAASNGDINIPGSAGGDSNGSTNLATGGSGGNAGNGGGGAVGTASGSAGTALTGASAVVNSGGGGGGGLSNSTATSAAGGVGGRGIIIVTEYYGS